jgi:hypothetical protein
MTQINSSIKTDDSVAQISVTNVHWQCESKDVEKTRISRLGNEKVKQSKYMPHSRPKVNCTKTKKPGIEKNQSQFDTVANQTTQSETAY